MKEVINLSNKGLTNALGSKGSCAAYLGILEGINNGRVWVNSLEKPTFAIVWSERLEGFQLMGKPIEYKEYGVLRSFIEGDLKAFLSKKDIDTFEYAADSEVLLEMLRDVFCDREIDSAFQHNYKVMEYKLAPINEDETTIIKMDKDFFARDCNNIPYVLDEIKSAWGSVDNFIINGVGFALLREKEIVSKVISIATYGGEHVISIDTLESHRKSGYAYLLGRKILNDALESGYRILWDCDEENFASIKTAEKLGLVFDYKYKVCWFEL